jgi:chromate reductase
MTAMRVLAISGSLRAGSHNCTLLRAAAAMLPPGIEVEEFEGLRAVPPYDQDHDRVLAPAAVRDLRDAIATADAVLIATPEYNASIAEIAASSG